MKNKPTVVFDTNIFIKGIFSEDEDNPCVKIIESIKSRRFQLLFAQDTIGELVYVMKNFVRKNIDETSDRIEMLKWLMELFYYSTSVNTCNTTPIELNNKYDEMFLKCAIEGKADYLISDDFKSGLHNVNNKDITAKITNSQDFCKLIYEAFE